MKFQSLSTLLTFAEPLYHDGGIGSCNIVYKGGSSMLPSSDKRLSNVYKHGKYNKLEESSDLKSLKSHSQ